MTMRLKKRHFIGATRPEAYDAKAPVLPGAWMAEERKALNEKAVNMTEDETIKAATRMYAKQLKNGAGKKKTNECPPLINMHLAHGDMVVMHGAEMQKYYEVCHFSPA